MKVGICHKQGSFSDTWIKYCQEHGISYHWWMLIVMI